MADMIEIDAKLHDELGMLITLGQFALVDLGAGHLDPRDRDRLAAKLRAVSALAETDGDHCEL